MPIEPVRKDLIRERLIRYFKPKEGTNIHKRAVTQSLIRRLFETGRWYRPGTGELDNRNLSQVEDIFIHAYRKHRPTKHLTSLPYVTLRDIIRSFFVQGVKKVNVLDVGAGNGNVGNDLSRLFGNQIKYTGVDLKPREKKSVKQLDVVSEKLPFETYHLIFGANIFQYLPDKFKALENMINALKPGGILKLAVADYNILYDAVFMDLDVKKDPAFYLTSIIKKYNPFLEVEISDYEIRIYKKTSGKVNLPFRFVGSRFENSDIVHNRLENDRFDGDLNITSYYQFDESRKSKW